MTRLDAVMLPKVRTPGDVEMTAKLLTQIELARDFETRARIGIEAQIEDATGLLACRAIATASPRMETLIFRARRLQRSRRHPDRDDRQRTEHYPGDHLNYVFSRLAGGRGPPGSRHPGDRRPVCGVRRRRGRLRARALARAHWGWTASGRSTRARSPPSTRSSPPPARSGSAPRPCSPPIAGATGLGRGATPMFEGEMIDQANRRMAERLAGQVAQPAALRRGPDGAAAPGDGSARAAGLVIVRRSSSAGHAAITRWRQPARRQPSVALSPSSRTLPRLLSSVKQKLWEVAAKFAQCWGNAGRNATLWHSAT